MKEMNKVIVKINGSEYPMVGEKSEQHMLNVARYVDEEIKRISEANPKLSTSVLAILSAVNIANELFECGEENDKLSKENEELNKKVGTGEEELKLEMKKLQLSLQGKAKEEEDLKTKIDELNKLIEEQESDIQSKDKQIEEYKVEVNELKDLTKIAEEKARVAEQMSSKFQNDAYRVQLEKIEIENELKFYKATR